MSLTQLLIVLFLTTILISIVTFFIHRKIAKHLGAKYAKYIHLFVAAVSFYYLVDSVLTAAHHKILFILFWLIIICSQLYFYFKRSI